MFTAKNRADYIILSKDHILQTLPTMAPLPFYLLGALMPKVKGMLKLVGATSRDKNEASVSCTGSSGRRSGTSTA